MKEPVFDLARRSHRTSRYLSWCLVLGVALLVSDVAPLDTLKFIALSAILGFSGSSISTRLIPNTSQLTRLAIGFVLVLPLWTVLDQILRVTDVRGSALPLVAAMGAATRRETLDSERMKTLAEGSSPWEAVREPVLIGLLATLLLGQTWIWLRFPVIVASLLFLWLSVKDVPTFHALRTPRTTIALVGLLTTLVALAITRRPGDWWLPGYGLDEIEYLSHAAFTYGPAMDVLAAGIPISYQWLNFATLGLLENAVGTTDFVVVTRFEFIAAAIWTAMLLWGLMREVLGTHRRSFAAAGVTCLISTVMFYPNPYSVFSLNHHSFAAAYLMAIPLSLVVWRRANFSWLSFIPVAACVHSMLAVKTAVAVPVAAAVAASALLFVVQRKWSVFTQLVILGLSLAFHLILSIKSSSGISIDLEQPFRFVGQFVSPNWGPRRSGVLGVAILAALSGLAILVLIRWLWNPHLRFVGVVGSTMLCSGLFFAVFSFRVSYTHLHLLQMSVVVLMPFSVIEVFGNSTARWVLSHPLRAVLIVGPAIAAGLAIPLLALPSSPLNLSLGWAFSIGLGERLTVIGAGALCVLLAVAFLASAVLRRRSPKPSITGLMLLIVVTFSVTSGLTNTQLLSRMGLMNSGVAEGQLGTADLRRATKWIEDNTDVSEILATNALFSTTHFKDTCAFTAQDQATTLVENAENYHPPVVFAKRRFLAIIPAYASITSGRNLDDRVRASLLFACNPSETNRQVLIDYGVRWYLAYLPDRPKDFPPPDIVRFTAGSYAVVELAASS